MSNVQCSFQANGQPNAATGVITLKDCNPPISNDETLSSWDVIGIVAIIVVFGIIVQYFMHHINVKKLKAAWETDTQNNTPARAR